MDNAIHLHVVYSSYSMASYTAQEIAKRRSGPDADSVDYSNNLNDVFKIAARNMESVYSISMDIQEKYLNSAPLAKEDK